MHTKIQYECPKRTAISRGQGVRGPGRIEIRHRTVYVGIAQIRTGRAQRVFDYFVQYARTHFFVSFRVT